MEWNVWGPLFGQVLVSVLKAQGQPEKAAVITDALSAAQAGKNVDDILRAKAAEWAEKGEPTVEQLAATRQEIQARLG